MRARGDELGANLDGLLLLLPHVLLGEVVGLSLHQECVTPRADVVSRAGAHFDTVGVRLLEHLQAHRLTRRDEQRRLTHHERRFFVVRRVAEVADVQLGQRQQRRIVDGVVVVGCTDEGERDNTRLKAAELREYFLRLTSQQCAFLVELVQALAVLTFDDVEHPVLFARQIGEFVLPALVFVLFAQYDHHDTIHRPDALGAPVDDVLCRVVGQHRIQQPGVLLGHGSRLHVRRVHQQAATANGVNLPQGILGLLPQPYPGSVRVL